MRLSLSIAAALSMASMRACDVLLPALSADFRVPVGVAGWSISAFVLAYGLLQLVYGPLGDNFGKLRVICAALAACSVANVLAALAPTMTALAIARGLSGAAAAGIIPMSMARIGDTVPIENRQQALARLLLATVGGLIVGQWISGLIADALHWRVVFMVLAAGFGIVAFRIRTQASGAAPDLPPRRSFGGQVRTVLDQPWARRILLVTALEGLFALSGFAFVPAYLHRQFGLGLSASGAVMTMYGVGGLAYVALSGVLIRHFSRASLASLGGVLLGSGFAIVASGSRWEWSVLGCFLGGFGFYTLHNTLQTEATQMSPEARGTAIGLFAATLFFGQAIGTGLAAVAVDSVGETFLFYIAALALPAVALAFGKGAPRRALTGRL
ncbi:MFS transporter [Cupriavidus sp. 8B]